MATVSHPVFARVYERLSVAMDRAGTAAFRRDLVAGLSGRVIEIGAGNGRMFAHYPPGVTEVVAVEPERRLRAAAERAASTAPVPVTVVDGLAEALPAGDGEFDAAVVALVLCTVPDQASALAEISRVLRPGGQVRFFEHVAAEEASGLHRAQRLPRRDAVAEAVRRLPHRPRHRRRHRRGRLRGARSCAGSVSRPPATARPRPASSAARSAGARASRR